MSFVFGSQSPGRNRVRPARRFSCTTSPCSTRGVAALVSCLGFHPFQARTFLSVGLGSAAICRKYLALSCGMPRSLDLGGDIGPPGAWGDELPGQVGQYRCGCVGAGDHHGLVLQGRDDLAGPGGVPPAPAGFEPGVNPCLARALQVGWGGPGGDGPPGWRRAPGQGPSTSSHVLTPLTI